MINFNNNKKVFLNNLEYSIFVYFNFLIWRKIKIYFLLNFKLRPPLKRINLNIIKICIYFDLFNNIRFFWA